MSQSKSPKSNGLSSLRPDFPDWNCNLGSICICNHLHMAKGDSGEYMFVWFCMLVMDIIWCSMFVPYHWHLVCKRKCPAQKWAFKCGKWAREREIYREIEKCGKWQYRPEKTRQTIWKKHRNPFPKMRGWEVARPPSGRVWRHLQDVW